MRLLIADDDAVSRRLLRKFLEPLGDCDVAVNGGDAIEKYNQACVSGKRYQLICLDVMMPEIDGTEVLAEIRAEENRANINFKDAVKIVIMTGINDAKSISQIYQNGCEAVISKPIDRDRLYKTLFMAGIEINKRE